MITYKNTSTDKELEDILALQQANLLKNTSEEERKVQGFVTVEHNFDILKQMHNIYPHTIAVANNKVVGYVLSMSVEFGSSIPVLVPMFEEFKEHNITEDFIVMGQVCVDKAYRGKGIFSGLYQQMKTEMSPHFKYIITEIATRNTRSMRAHEKVGFKVIHIFSTPAEEWAIVAWDWE